MSKKLFVGAGGPDAPTNTDDNLKSEDIVEFALAVSEGPIRGLTDGAKSFYVGETALVNSTGVRNFDKFAIGVHPGYPEGSALPLDLKLGGVTSNTAVGVHLVQNVPVVRDINGALRGTIDQLEVRVQIGRLVTVKEDGGTANNTARFSLEYKLSNATTWERFVTKTLSPILGEDGQYTWEDVDTTSAVVEVNGKTTVGYIKEFTVDVPRVENDDWSIRMVKLSPDNDEHDVVDLSWESYQCTNKTKTTYPDTAIVHGIGVANGQFSSIPEFGGVYDGLICRVPTNYNPDLRTYDETTPWDGSFKFAWTNNPAWLLYEMITNTRFGLAKHRRYVDANRFSFYEAATWCDTPVPVAGSSETRPRYTFNDVIIEPRPGMEMLNYIAGSFNALVWDDLQGQIHLKVDKDEPAVQIFSPENVTEAGFAYSFSDITTRANDISVSFINPELDWNEDRRRIPNITTNEENIEKFGRIPLDFIAVGCTNVHEAIAKAQVRLISSLTETTMVAFTTTRQGAMLSLFEVILIADPVMGWSTTGRMTSYDDHYVYFRDAIYIETIKEYTIKVQTQTGLIEATVMPDEIGHVNRLHIMSSPLPENLPRHAVFSLEESGGYGFAKPFRVLGIDEVEGSPYLYRVNAVEINRNKYLLSELATPITEPQYGYNQPYLPGQPTNFKAVSGDDQLLVTPTGEVISRILASWRKPFNSIVSGYEFQYRLLNDEAWQSIKTTETSTYTGAVISKEHYSLRVAAFDQNGNRSAWATISDYTVAGKTKVPANALNLQATGGIFQIELNWNYGLTPAKDIKKVELWANSSNAIGTAFKLTDLSYPANKWTHLGLGVEVKVYYWIRVQDTSGNYSAFSSSVNATTSKDASAILKILEGQINAGQLHDDLNTHIENIDGAIEDLVNTYGDTAGAATSAASAASSLSSAIIAKAAAELAAGNSTTAAAASQASRLAAETANTNAGTSASAALTSAGNASTYATAAGTAATASQASSVTANTAKNNAETAASAASTSKDTAATQATAAGTSAAAASTSATTAATKAGEASTSATNAATSETNALGSKNAAATSATNAATSATNASNSASASSGFASSASTQATNASNSATAANSAKVAAESARDGAAGSASAASTSASTASTKATDAATSANAASSSATTASTKAGEALTYRNNAASSANDALGYANASAQDYSAVTARLNNATGPGSGITVEQKFSANASTLNGLSAQYTVKIDAGNGAVSGFGLASTAVNGAPLSQFIVNANVFGFTYPGQSTKYPFMIGLVNGVSTVGVNGALVVDGTLVVREANIVDANITTLKIGGNAVTVPQSAYTAGLSSTGSSMEAQSITVFSSGGPAVVTFGAHVYSNHHETLYMSLYRDGALLFNVGGGSGAETYLQGEGMETGSVVDYPGYGVHTYSLQVGSPGNTTWCSARCITYLEVKR